MDIDYQWRGDLSDEELYSLTLSYGGRASVGWWDMIRPHSFGWIAARRSDASLVGFVNVAWDGCDHAFLLDPKVHPDDQHAGVGTELVRRAAARARSPAVSGSTSTSTTTSLRSISEPAGFSRLRPA